MQVEHQTLTIDDQSFHITANWLDQIPDYQTIVNYPVMIICAGGGFAFLSGREAQPIANRFAAEGFHTVLLNYQLADRHTPTYPRALKQVAATVDWITRTAADHHADTERIILTGFSAGGHLVATYNGVANDPRLCAQYGLNHYHGHIAATVLAYPVIDLNAGYPQTATRRDQITPDRRLWAAQKLVTDASKPTFIWQTQGDQTVPPRNSLMYAQALLAHAVPVDYHLFSQGEHGLALANQLTQVPHHHQSLEQRAQQWPTLAVSWFHEQGLLAGPF
ncbi:alpha/beta hydrolase [Lactiplantibacillus modestisalitolerans]|uniref:Alpha/beta hydrolase n=1 Tax=Lactiplantibacillus modestisalitolerans TaxID=1457219 RepID=A0ABV5WR85_9LACO|nr:alpha/beta hydrolase [Lactiplantibacillus modestisalitolerans]